MKKLFAIGSALAFAALMTLGATMARADDNMKLVWGGGKPEASAYSGVYVPQVVKALEGANMSGYTWGGVTDGTVDNAERVSEHPTHLAVGQLDILTAIQGKPIPGKPGATYQFTFLKKDLGPECLYVVTAKATFKTWGHVLGNAWDDMQVFTGGPKSGSMGTWNTLVGIYPDLKDVKVVNAGGNDQILEKVASTPGSIGFFVMRPDPESKIFETIQSKKLTLVPVVDLDLDNKGYDYLTLQVANAAWYSFSGGKSVTTACTHVALITGDPASPNLGSGKRRLEETIKRVALIKDSDLQPNTGGWATMFSNLKAAAGSDTKALLAASKEALDSAVKKATN